MAVFTDFPGGSAVVKNIDQERQIIRIVPESNPGRGWEVWWYFRVEGLKVGSTITFEVTSNGFGLPDKAQFSYDNKKWAHIDQAGERKGRTLMIYSQKVIQSTVWLAWGPPFVLSDAEALVKKVTKKPYARSLELARSIEGRSVPAVVVSQKGTASKNRPVIWVQARSHAWESGSSWVGRGFIEWLVSKDPLAESLRKNALIYFVPVLDVDNVESGAGGKQQLPHDHYWDWSASPHFPEVRAAKSKISGFIADKSLKVFMDLHNPGAGNKEVLFFVPAKPLLISSRLQQQDEFFKIAKEEMGGPSGFKGLLGPIGEGWDALKEPACDCWVADESNKAGLDALAVTMETPWNISEGNQSGYLSRGAELGRSIARFVLADKP